MRRTGTGTQPRVLADRYLILEQLGSGGAGAVWRAHDRVLDRTVAVKSLHADVAADPATAHRFRAEASAAAKLTHPNAVIVHDIDRADGRDFLVMELVDGVTLAELLRDGPLPAEVVASLGVQIGSALGAAHAEGLVHRDVKPANVLITADGVAKVADFGIARALGDVTSQLTRPGHVMGTARYLAPEQLRDVDVDARADVYALGLVLYQATTGYPPFGEGTTVEVAVRRLTDELGSLTERVSDVPAALEAAVRRATARSPDDRFRDGAEVAAALADVAAPQADRLLAERVARALKRADAPAAADVVTGAGSSPVDVPTAMLQQPPSTSVLSSMPGSHPAEPVVAEVDPGWGPPIDPVPTSPGGPPPVDATVWPEHDDPAPSRRRRVVTTLAAITVVAAGATGAAIMLNGDGETDLGAASGDGQELALGDTPSAAPADVEDADDEAQQVRELRVVDGLDHDPFGSGNEHRDSVPAVYDGDHSTSWQTSTYRGNPALGGLKPGVGVWLDLGAEVDEVTSIEVVTATPGLSFTVFAGDAAPSAGVAPEEWGREVEQVEDAAERTVLDFEDAPIDASVYLVWVTELPPTSGGFQAKLAEVIFEGR